MDLGIKVSRDEFENTTTQISSCISNHKFKFQPKPFSSNNFSEYNRNELLTTTFAKESKTTNLLNKIPDVITAATAVQTLLLVMILLSVT